MADSKKGDQVETNRIMVVEDESITARDIAQFLLGRGYGVVDICASGEAAMESAKKCKPDLILMDIRLQTKMDGIQAAGKIHEFLDVPIIFLTAHSDRVTLDRAKVTMPHGYLLKPFEDDDLFAAIETATYKHGMEKLVKESEEKYRAVLEQSGDGIILLDASDFRILEANRAALDFLGYSGAELGKMTFLELFPVGAELGSGIYGQEDLHLFLGENFLKGKDGTMLEVELSGRTITFGKKDAFCLVVRDISRRKNAERTIRSLNSFRESIIENAPCMVSVVDPAWKILVWNKSAEVMTGIKSYEAIGSAQTWGRLLHGGRSFSSLPPIFGKIGFAIADREVVEDFELRITNAAGQQRTISLTAKGLEPDGEDGAQNIIIFGRDVTDFKAAQEALIESEERHRRLFEFSPEAFFLLDTEGRIISVNESAERLAGISRSEMWGKDILGLKLWGPGEVERNSVSFRAMRECGRMDPFEVYVRTADGSGARIVMSAVPLERQGKPYAVQVITQRTSLPICGARTGTTTSPTTSSASGTSPTAAAARM